MHNLSILEPRCQEQDILLVPGAVDEVNDRKDNNVKLVTIQDNNDGKGWDTGSVPNNYIDIKLVHGVEMTSIQVVKGSNCKKFELWNEDINEMLYKTKVNLFIN